jgi:hypothetical protein
VNPVKCGEQKALKQICNGRAIPIEDGCFFVVLPGVLTKHTNENISAASE